MPFRNLSELPLFQGMSINHLHEASMQVNISTVTMPEHKTVLHSGDPADMLLFLAQGSVISTCFSDDDGYAVSEAMMAPEVLQPECIFGMTQHFTRSYVTRTPCTFIRISKPHILKLAGNYEIFRINLLNITCTRAQRLGRAPWLTQPTDIKAKIAQFAQEHCVCPTGEKTLHIKMQRLADEIGESRLNVSKTLRLLQQEGLIGLKREVIHIPALENL